MIELLKCWYFLICVADHYTWYHGTWSEKCCLECWEINNHIELDDSSCTRYEGGWWRCDHAPFMWIQNVHNYVLIVLRSDSDRPLTPEPWHGFMIWLFHFSMPGDLCRRDRNTEYTWAEIEKHSERSSRWIVIDDLVYDVTEWSRKHPGGSVLLGHFAGQDASVSHENCLPCEQAVCTPDTSFFV